MTYNGSCIIREVPLPQREYYVAPPERWEGTSRPAASRRRRRRRTVKLFPALLALALVFSFLLGRASARGRLLSPSSTARDGARHEAQAEPEAGTPVTVLPAEPAAPAEEAPAEGLPAEGPSPAEPVLAAEEWNLVLINRDHLLPENYEAPELTQLANGHAVDSRIYPALQEMMDGARAAGVQPTICSSFRTWAKQESLYKNKVARLKSSGWDPETVEDEAARWVARPGTSEHQAGLAVDIVDRGYQSLTHRQEDTAAQKWLMAHCWEYGFILRYPSDKSEITGVGYEPWHYRYVGKDAALEMKELGVCLEEYLADQTAPE